MDQRAHCIPALRCPAYDACCNVWCSQIRRCGISSRLVAAAYLHASGHSADLCSQMALPPLWAQLANAQPRLSFSMAAQLATPTQAVRPPPGEMLTNRSDDTSGSPSFLSLVDVTPVRLHDCSPTAEVRIWRDVWCCFDAIASSALQCFPALEHS